MRCSEAGFTRRCRSMLASRFIIGWKNIFFLYVLKRADDDAPSFSVLPASDAFDSLLLARLTYRRPLPLPPSSCCPLCYYKERPAVIFPGTQQGSRSEAFNSIYDWCKILRDVAVLVIAAKVFPVFFTFTFVIYKFRNVSVRKCRMVQLAKFFMQLISIRTNSLYEIKLSLRSIISTATRQ